MQPRSVERGPARLEHRGHLAARPAARRGRGSRRSAARAARCRGSRGRTSRAGRAGRAGRGRRAPAGAARRRAACGRSGRAPGTGSTGRPGRRSGSGRGRGAGRRGCRTRRGCGRSRRGPSRRRTAPSRRRRRPRRRRSSRPGVFVRSYGLRVAPKTALNVCEPAPNSGVFVLPITIAPGGAQALDEQRVVLGHVLGEQRRAVRGAHARRVLEVLDRDRQAVQDAARRLAVGLRPPPAAPVRARAA